MAINMVSFQRRQEKQTEPRESALDLLMKGLQVAGAATGIYQNVEQGRAASASRERAQLETKVGTTQEAERTAEDALSQQGKLSPKKLLEVAEKGGFQLVGEEQKNDPGVLTRYVKDQSGEKPVYLKQALQTRQAFQGQQNDMQIQAKKELESIKNANAQKLENLRKAVSKEPSQSELQKVQQAEAMIIANDGLSKDLEDPSKFDPTSRVYMGQMGVAIGAKAPKWQAYETKARQFLDPIARARTGAAMPDSEFQSYMQQYFPLPGDGPDMVLQKAQFREKAIDEVMSQGRRAIPKEQTRLQPSAAPKSVNKPLKANQLPDL